jgi:NAD(P)-dependent dehydrogenase (short-subunit alcohol dehydrogenase family)
LHEYTEEQMQRSTDLKFSDILYAVRAVLAIMMEQVQRWRSRVRGLNSRRGERFSEPRGVRRASKAALADLARSISVEYGPAGIRMNVVSPGAIVTPAAGSPKSDQLDARFELVPMRRRGEPEETADAVVFCASALPSYVAGQTLTVDGGASSFLSVFITTTT